MKRFRLLNILLLWLATIGSMTTGLTAQTSRMILNSQVGALRGKLAGLDGVTDLTVQGVIDAQDLKAIAEILPNIIRLDLEEVSFKALIDPYDPYSSTSDDCFTTGLSYKTKKLQELILPASITKIADYAFGGLKALTKLTCPTTVVPAVEGWGSDITDSDILAQCTLYVREDMVEAFKASKSWGFHAILPIPSGGGAAFEPDLSLTVTTSATFSITVGAEGDAVTVHYPDGVAETKVGADGALTLSFNHAIDESKVAGETTVLISAPKAIRLTTQGTGLTACSFIKELPLEELSLRFEGELTALDLSSLSSLTTVNLSQCAKLATLTLPTQAPQLRTLLLPGTAVGEVTLTAYSSLKELDLAGVGLSAVSLSGLTKLTSLDLSDNKLSTINLSGLTALTTLRLGDNQLSELHLSSTDFDELNVENNRLATIDLSQVTRIGAFYCSGNRFTLDKLPTKGSVISAYLYAPQAKHQIAESIARGEEIDLSAVATLQGVLSKPTASTFSWYDHEGNYLMEGIDYEVRGAGQFAFLRTFPDSVYCRVESKAFPKFTGKNSYETTRIAITEPLVAANFIYYTSKPRQNFSVKTLPGGTVTVRTADGATLMSTGDDEYGIARFAHRIDTDKVTDQKRMKMEVICEEMYSYAAQGTGITEVELTNCPKLQRLTLKSQQLTSIVLSTASALEELYLDGNSELTQLDLTGLNSLRWLNVSNLPHLTTIDLTQLPALTHLLAYNTQCANLPVEFCPNLQVLDVTNTGTTQLKVASLSQLQRLLVADNQLETLETSGLTALTELQVAHNKLSELILNAPNLETLSVEENHLTSLDLSSSTQITTLYCQANRLSLDKLPARAIGTYVYAPQAPMSWSKASYSTDDEIDLSHLTQLQGVLDHPVVSTFSCYEAKSTKRLQEGRDYKVLREGVFQFVAPHTDGVYFAITTPAFPDFIGEEMYLTEPIEITQGTNICTPAVGEASLQVTTEPTGITLATSEVCSYALYDLSGVRIYGGILTTGRTQLSLAPGSYLLVYRLAGVSYSVKLVIPARYPLTLSSSLNNQ